MTNEEEERLMQTLASIHRRINQFADEEARSTLVRGWAARGGLLTAKAALLDQAESILKRLMEDDRE